MMVRHSWYLLNLLPGEGGGDTIDGHRKSPQLPRTAMWRAHVFNVITQQTTPNIDVFPLHGARTPFPLRPNPI